MNGDLELVESEKSLASLLSALKDLPVYRADDAKLHFQFRAALAGAALAAQTHNFKRAWMEFRIAEAVLKKIAEEPANNEHLCTWCPPISKT